MHLVKKITSIQGDMAENQINELSGSWMNANW